MKRFSLLIISAFFASLLSPAFAQSDGGEIVGAPAGENADPSMSPEQFELKLGEFGQIIEVVLNRSARVPFSQLLNQDRFASKIAEGVAIEELDEDLKKLMISSIESALYFFDWQPYTRFRFLRMRQQDGKLGLLFRCVSPRGVLSYFTFFAAPKPPDNQLRIIDIYNHRAAAYQSSRAQQAFVITGTQYGWLDMSQLDNLQPSFYDYTILTEMTRALEQENTAQVQQSFKKLSKEVQRLPQALMMVMASSVQSESLFSKLQAVMEKVSPNSMAPELMLLDKYLLEENYPAAIETIDSLHQKTGGDPFLDVRKARCFYKMGELEDASKFCLTAIRAEPKLVDPYVLLVDIQVDQKQYEKAFDMLKLLGDNFNLLVENESFEDNEDFEDFRSSEWYQKWLDYRTKRQAELEQLQAQAAAEAEAAQPQQ